MVPFEFLGPYRIGEMIGRGGMGTVYRAVHVKTGEPVAVKLIAGHVADDPQFRRRFASEVETLKRLKHRNIVTLIGYGEQSGQLFYSMELVEGESLQQRLRRQKRLPWPDVLELAIDVCAALKHAHDFGVYHRDLKLANLLIAGDGTVKLVDFGVAKLFGSQDHTAAGSILGTAEYMAPEQADGGPVTPRTDLYALGNVLYACFSGRPPFAGRTLTRALEALRAEEPARIDAIVPDLPTEIAELIHDLLEKRPEDRPPTALAVMNRLKAIRAGLARAASDAYQEVDTLGPPAVEPTHLSQPRHDRPTAASTGDSKTLGHFAEGATASASPSSERLTIKATLPSEHGSPGDVEPVDPPSERTHFRTVEEQDRHGRLWGAEHDEEDPASKLWHLLSIAALVLALIAAASVVIWAMRPPDADRLYSSAMSVADRGNKTEFLALANQFLKLFPQDPRTAELQERVADAEARRILSRLELAAAHKGGTHRLKPAEAAFVTAMNRLHRDPRGTEQLLQRWLDVYRYDIDQPEVEAGADGGAVSEAAMQDSVPHSHLIRAAELELANLVASRRAGAEDPRVTQLKQRIEWGEQNLGPEEQAKLLRGIVELHGDQPWAEPVVEQARQRLAELDG